MPRSSTTAQLTMAQRIASVAMGVVLIGVFAWVGYAALNPQPSPLQEALRSLASSNEDDSTAAAAYTDAFDASYRPDAGVGNVAIAAVYYTPQVQAALNALPKKSAHQDELASVLDQEGANDQALAFYTMIDSVVSQVGIDLAAAASLTDGDGRSYALMSSRPIYALLPQPEGQVRTTTVLFFAATADDGTAFSRQTVSELTLTVRDVADIPERRFRWDLRLVP
ncbi:MAG: hypothetical protein HYZ09_00355 [Candidatus Kerfeldbacteria bacterium]|nr:hypothetical protein [Candidatus Kerfeldbacteria bacterium]